MPTPNMSTTRIVVPFDETEAPDFAYEVDERRRHRVGEEDDDQRRERDQHRAIDQPEQDQDEQDGRAKQLGVEIAEHLLGVGGEADVAREQDPHPAGLLAGDVANRLAPVGLTRRSWSGR